MSSENNSPLLDTRLIGTKSQTPEASANALADYVKKAPIDQEDSSSEASNEYDSKISQGLTPNGPFNQQNKTKSLKKIPSVLADQVAERKFTFSNDSPIVKNSNDNTEEKNKFITNCKVDNFRLMKGYLSGAEPLLRLYYTKLEPFERKLASLCIVHGLGEHSGRYMEVAEFFANRGYVVHLIDLRGFGFSGGPRSNSSVEELHRDIEVLLKQANPNLPLFLYGHSMGASLVMSLLIKNPFLRISGVILTSGLFGFPKERNMPWIKRTFIKLAGNVLEEFMVSSGINTTALSNENYCMKSVLEDKLMSSSIGFKQVKGLVELVEFNIPHAARFNYPCLIIHGNKDLITDYRASIKLFKTISSEHKELKIVEDGLHELHHDLGKGEFKLYILQWMENRLQKSKRNIGDFHILQVGLRSSNKYVKTLWGLLIIGIYSYLLRYFRGHQLYDTKFKKFWYPIFYIYNVLLKRHSLGLKIKGKKFS